MITAKRQVLVLVFAIAACVTALAASPDRADATFPGANGKIVFSSNGSGNPDIYAMNSDGSGGTRLTGGPESDFWPAFSPDGERIAFLRSAPGSSHLPMHPTAEIYVINADGSGLQRLTSNTTGDGHPAFSPDGDRIVFTSRRDGNPEIYVMNVDGSGQTRLTTEPTADYLPQFAPVGETITFTRGPVELGLAEIYVMQDDGSGQTRLTDNSVADFWSSFSPDGSRITFSRYHPEPEAGGKPPEIFVMGDDGSAQTQLTTGFYDEYPVFSPAGDRIAYQRIGAGFWDILGMKDDGSEQSALAAGPAMEQQVDWGTLPDARDLDADDDRVGDGIDRCPAKAGATESGCPSVKRRLTLGYARRARAFKGRLSSAVGACVRGQRVIIRKVRKGPDRVVGRRLTRANGAYKLRRKRRPGRYYATVAARLMPGAAECLQARSAKLRLR